MLNKIGPHGMITLERVNGELEAEVSYMQIGCYIHRHTIPYTE